MISLATNLFRLTTCFLGLVAALSLSFGQNRPASATSSVAMQKSADALESWNVYDSLAEDYERLGNSELAIKNYKQSLALNAGNTNAIEYLKKVGE